MPYGAPPPFAQPPLQPKPPMGVNQQTRRPADQQTPSPYPVMPESWQFPQAHPQAPPVYPVPTPAPSGGTTEEERAAWLAANKRKAEAKWQYDMALRQQQQIKAPSAKQGKSTSTKSGSQSIKAGGMSGLSGLPSLSGPGLSAISTKTKKIPQYSEADSETRREVTTTSSMSAQKGKTSTTTGMSLDRFKPPASKGPPLSLRDEYLTRLLRGPRPPPPVQKCPPATRMTTALPCAKSGPSTSHSERSSQTINEHSSLSQLPSATTVSAGRPEGFRPAKPQAVKRSLPEGLTVQSRTSVGEQAEEGPAHKKRMPAPPTVSPPSPEVVKAFLGEEEFYNIRTVLINQQEEFMQQVWELHGLYRLQKRKMTISNHAHSKDGRALHLDHPPPARKAAVEQQERNTRKADPPPVKVVQPPASPVSIKPPSRDEIRVQSSTVGGPSGQGDNGSSAGHKETHKFSGIHASMPAPAGACQPPPYFPQPTYPPGLGWPGAVPVGSGTDGVSGSQSHETYMHALMQYYSTASNGKDATAPPQPGLPPHMQMPVHPFQMMGASAPGGPMAMGAYPVPPQQQQPSGDPQEPGGKPTLASAPFPPYHMYHANHPHGLPPGQPYPGFEAMLQSWYGPLYAGMPVPPKEASGSVPKDNSGSGNPSTSSPQDTDSPSAEKPDTPEDGSTDATGAAQPVKSREAKEVARDKTNSEVAPRKSSESGQPKKAQQHWWKSPTDVFGAAAISAVLKDDDTEVHGRHKYGMKGPAKLARKLLANHIKELDRELCLKDSPRSRSKATSKSKGSICSDGSASAPCDG